MSHYEHILSMDRSSRIKIVPTSLKLNHVFRFPFLRLSTDASDGYNDAMVNFVF